MKIFVEVPPTSSRRRLREYAELLKGLVNAVFVPEAPLGYPKALAIVVAHIIGEAVGVPAIASIRTRDVNANALISMLGAAKLLGLYGVLITRGDPPAFGKEVSDIGTEDAIKLVRTNKRLRGLRVGVVVSLAKDLTLIRERLLNLDIDFAFVTRMWSPSQVKNEVFEKARGRGVEIVPYVVVSREEDFGKVFELLRGHQRIWRPQEVPSLVEELKGLVDGVLITSPYRFETVVEVLKSLVGYR